jgi:hypothetical protein
MQISKQRKIELFIISTLSVIVFCSFVNFRSLHAKFHNKTGEDLDSLVVAGTLIGHLESENSTENIDFKNFNFDGSLPYEQISGIINNKKLYQLNWSWCGTERNTRDKGSYIFDIKKTIDENGKACLFLVGHNEKMFWEETESKP